MKNTRIAVLMMIVVTALISGCASLGPKFESVSVIPDSQAVIYIYRPSRFVGGAVKPSVYDGDKVITELVSGGYYPYFVNPGKVELWSKTESKSSVELVAEKGRTYFVRGTIGMGVFVGRPHLEVVPEKVGMEEIKECKRVMDSEKQKAAKATHAGAASN